jgi:hypothetical protein
LPSASYISNLCSTRWLLSYLWNLFFIVDININCTRSYANWDVQATNLLFKNYSFFAAHILLPSWRRPQSDCLSRFCSILFQTRVEANFHSFWSRHPFLQKQYIVVHVCGWRKQISISLEAYFQLFGSKTLSGLKHICNH